MKQTKILLFMFAILIQFSSASFLEAQKTVYYLSGVGNQLLSLKGDAIDPSYKWPYEALRDFYIERGYDFRLVLPDVLDKEFYNNLSCIFANNIRPAKFIRTLGKAGMKKIIIIQTEPPHVVPLNYVQNYLDRYPKILTYNNDMVDGKKFKKYNFPRPILDIVDDIVPFKEKKLCALINSHKRSLYKNRDQLYTARKRVIKYFEVNHPEDFDLYGNGWPKSSYPSYQGTVKSKTDVLKHYKFTFTYENIKELPGYVTEKIFDAMIAGSVPIYLGAPDICDIVPKECFVDARNFNSFDEIYRYISQMSEERYQEHIEAIKAFLLSDKAYPFGIESFVKTLVTAHNELTDENLTFD
ncbi:MAG: hypothetical protein S4CHLAM20_09700 [Chlamydiia bacterium]|nr:hypothetical protein [Chlamydiia bacterium]